MIEITCAYVYGTVKITVSVPGQKPVLQPLAVEELFCAAMLTAAAVVERVMEAFMLATRSPEE
jgi:hypothetical protein